MKKNPFVIFLVLFVLFNIDFFCEASSLKINFIDVGEGDSILIETPNGKTVLIDAGNLITGFNVVEFLKKKRIDNSDFFILTHPDLDHMGGVFFILQMINVKKIYDNGQNLSEWVKSSDIYRWYDELVRKNKNYSVLKAGNRFLLDGVTFNVLWPYKLSVFSGFNANSLVIMIEYKNFRCLLAGDLTQGGENELLKMNKNLKADILKLGHHGSSDASSEEFLSAVSPKITVISVNKNNIRSYPSKVVLRRLRNSGSSIYRTDINGNIGVNIEQSGKIKIYTEKH